MASNSQRKIWSLMNKDVFTGFEVAKIVMSNIYELCLRSNPEEYELESVNLDEKFGNIDKYDFDMTEQLINNIKDDYDKKAEYRNWLEAFHHILHLIDHTHIMYLRVKYYLSFCTGIMQRYFNDVIIRLELSNMGITTISDEAGNPEKKNNILNNLHFMPFDPSIWERLGQTPNTFIDSQMMRVERLISLFLFSKTLLKIVSEVTGINFSEYPDQWYKRIESEIENYSDILNDALTFSARARQELGSVPTTINLDDLQISSELEEKFRERLSSPLERGIWIVECRKIFYDDLEARNPDFWM